MADAVLCWEKPPKAEPYHEWAAYQSDDCPPGNYSPNMDQEWRRRWKAKACGQRGARLRVEVRKTTGDRFQQVQVLLIVHEDGSVVMSMNGKAGFTAGEFAELGQAVEEARDAMREYRKLHPAPLPPVDDQGRHLCVFCRQDYVDDLRRRCDTCRKDRT
jgi:hypothetical protein